MLKTLAKIAAQGALIGAITLLLGEIVLRAYHRINPTFVFYDSSYNRFRGKPFAADWDFTLNSGGFKDLEFTAKPEGGYRIAAVGDSFAFGVVPYRNHYLTLLEEALRDRITAAEVLNLGIPGVGPKDYVAISAREALPLEPDLVLVSFFIGNDFIEAGSRELLSYSYVASLAYYLVTLSRSYQGRVIHGGGEYCDECPAFTEAAYLGIEHERSFIYLRDDTRLPALARVAARHLGEIRALCRAAGVALLVVLIPDELQVDPALRRDVLDAYYPRLNTDSWDTARPNRMLAAELDALGIEHIDLQPEFAARTEQRRLYRPRDTHWNIAGNALAAELIAPRLHNFAVRSTGNGHDQ